MLRLCEAEVWGGNKFIEVVEKIMPKQTKAIARIDKFYWIFWSRRGKPRRQRVFRILILILIFWFIYKFLFFKAALSGFEFFFFFEMLILTFLRSEHCVSGPFGNPMVVLCFASCHINAYTFVTRYLSL